MRVCYVGTPPGSELTNLLQSVSMERRGRLVVNNSMLWLFLLLMVDVSFGASGMVIMLGIKCEILVEVDVRFHELSGPT